MRAARYPLFAIYLIAFYAISMRAYPQIVLQKPAQEGCIAAHTFTELPAAMAGTQTDAYGKTTVALGAYERVSPDGRYILRSFSGARLGEVSLIELGPVGQAVRAIATPLKNEAFPVQGSWRYLVDTNGDHYTFSSILSRLDEGKPVFRGGMDGFYAAAAELPRQAHEPASTVRIRSMSWPNATGDAATQGQGALSVRTLTVDTQRQRIVADTGAQFICRERVREDGAFYALPMISVDGQEFAALPQSPVSGAPHMRIFGLGPDGQSCQLRSTLDVASGKTIFGFAHGPAPADLAYEYRAQVWWVYRGSGGQPLRLNLAPYLEHPHSQLLASAFPGITRDGRVVYAATYKDCAAPAPAGQAAASGDPGRCIERQGYVTTDPYQSNAYQHWLQQHPGAARRSCITTADVQRERAAFARLHGLR